MGTKIFDLVAFVFDLRIENFNFGYNIWMVSTKALIFHMSDPFDMTFPLVPKDLTLVFDLLVENFNLAIFFDW